MLNISNNPLAALLASTGTLAAVSALSVAGLVVVGLPAVAPEGHDSAVSVAAPRQAEWKESPATATLTAALSSPPSGWSADGEIQQSVTAPLPYSCPLPGTSASTALARSFTAGGQRIRVTTLAYTAGLGAQALQLQLANTGVCASDAAVRVSAISSPAQDARLATTTRGGITTSTAMSRRGDVITYITGPAGAPLSELSRAMDSVVSSKLNGACLNQESTASEATRSPFSPVGYQAFTEDAKVSIPKPALPTASPTVKAVPVPAPVLVPETAKPLPEPDYPVYPQMPAPVALPAAPEAPSEAATEATVAVPAQDKNGPGCGWAFTGMTGPQFDAEAARTARQTITSEANTRLVEGVHTWQAKTSEYWTAYAAYEKDAAAYNSYRAKVTEVNAAWSAIARTWDTFRANEAEYRAAVKNREDFTARKADAEASFAKATEVCNAPAPAPQPSQTPSPSSSPSPSASPDPSTGPTIAPTPPAAPTATPSPAVKAGCPAARPAILDQAAPSVPDKPTPPADPRPKQ